MSPPSRSAAYFLFAGGVWWTGQQAHRPLPSKDLASRTLAAA